MEKCITKITFLRGIKIKLFLIIAQKIKVFFHVMTTTNSSRRRLRHNSRIPNEKPSCLPVFLRHFSVQTNPKIILNIARNSCL